MDVSLLSVHRFLAEVGCSASPPYGTRMIETSTLKLPLYQVQALEATVNVAKSE